MGTATKQEEGVVMARCKSPETEDVKGDESYEGDKRGGKRGTSPCDL